MKENHTIYPQTTIRTNLMFERQKGVSEPKKSPCIQDYRFDVYIIETRTLTDKIRRNRRLGRLDLNIDRYDDGVRACTTHIKHE